MQLPGSQEVHLSLHKENLRRKRFEQNTKCWPFMEVLIELQNREDVVNVKAVCVTIVEIVLHAEINRDLVAKARKRRLVLRGLAV